MCEARTAVGCCVAVSSCSCACTHGAPSASKPVFKLWVSIVATGPGCTAQRPSRREGQSTEHLAFSVLRQHPFI